MAASAWAQTTTAPAQATRPRIRAAAVSTPVVIDGALDDEIWKRAEAVSNFTQSEPEPGKAASQRTDVWLAADKTTLYIAAHCHDQAGAEPVIADIRKDFTIGNQDSFSVIIDTFGDRRNGFLFATNPAGARTDQQVTNEGRDTNASWDAVWTVKAKRVDDGWTVEMAIPFRSLRFTVGGPAWGVNFARHLRRRNEIDYWAPVPRTFNLARVSLAGTIEGLDGVLPGRNLQIKPHVLGSTVRQIGGPSFKRSLDGGVDLKVGVTPSLTLDVTGRPDFAQAEADEQTVNLTQFSQFFPEKRDFFLENAGIFYVGDAQRNNRVNPTPTPDEDLLLFFSRRIGLSANGTPIPIAAGARLTGRAAGLTLGAMSLQTERLGAIPSTNYSVLRARRNVSRSSDIGALFVSRQSSSNDWNRVYGLDANIRLFGNLDWSSYVMNTATPNVSGGTAAWRTSFNWEGNFFHGKVGALEIGKNFRDDLAFYKRVGTRKWLADIGIRPRAAALKAHGIREFHPHITWNYYTDLSGRMIAKNLHNGFSTSFNNGALVEFSINPQSQTITSPLALATTAPAMPAGQYDWHDYKILFQTDLSRRLSAQGNYFWGGLWSGTQQTLQATVNIRPSYRFRLALGINRTAATLRLPAAEFVTALYTMRGNYSFSTNMYLDALVQYNADIKQMNTNVRFNLLHRPLSDLFIVYNEQRFTTPNGLVPGRGIIIKFTEMLGF
jgi:hypothetical protein